MNCHASCRFCTASRGDAGVGARDVGCVDMNRGGGMARDESIELQATGSRQPAFAGVARGLHMQSVTAH